MRCCFGLVLALLSFGSFATTVTIGVHQFPPYTFVDGDHCGGPAIEQTKRILADYNIELATVCLTPARMYKMLQSGEIDLSINVRSTKALAEQDFAEPYFTMLHLILVDGDPRWLNRNQKLVAAIRGFDYHGQRQQLTARGFSFYDAANADDAVEMFFKGRTSHLITYEAPFRALMQRDQITTEYVMHRIADVPTFYVLSSQSMHRDLLKSVFAHYALQHRCQHLDDCQSSSGGVSPALPGLPAP